MFSCVLFIVLHTKALYQKFRKTAKKLGIWHWSSAFSGLFLTSDEKMVFIFSWKTAGILQSSLEIIRPV